MTHSLADRMNDDQFAGYAYAYPHKTSYRRLDPPIRLSEAWATEEKYALFLYVHLPFCEMRCGFCNLFTTVQPENRFVTDTLNAIFRQSSVVADEIVPGKISQLALGGGTPSFLSVDQLELLFNNLAVTWPIEWNSVRCSFEVSPTTIDRERLTLLKERNVDRVSMGVQSFSASDLKHLGRPQSSRQVDEAITAIQEADFPVFNFDLIYGVEGQTLQSWLQTIRRAIAIRPDEIYLYPLYVRALTGLGRTDKSPSAYRRELFLAARDELMAAGYQQQSMRLFRRHSFDLATDYCCQEDGMIGLGPGARSYTHALHYSSEYAVGQTGVKRIISAFDAKSRREFALADYGVRLDHDEQRRRYLIKSLLRSPGVNLTSYRERFGSEFDEDFPQLTELIDLGLGVCDGETIRLTTEGMSWSDVIGPWLYSSEVTARMESFELV